MLALFGILAVACDGKGPSCNADGGCDPCDARCPSATPICDTHDFQCRTGCKNDGDCPATSPSCIDGTCHPKP